MINKYKKDNRVSFTFDEYILEGNILVIDDVNEQCEEISYDIFVEENNYPVEYPCLFKGILESQIIYVQEWNEKGV